ncbi:peptidase M23-like protein [Stackebrandtia endophytica]|uniref:Peptidase M23-like protein n=1 Tax=Stackebrandtia endophytica TaxID=1496996 RepID=A0A543B114_9ACTN|nr:M23 family metallopeptidase [Stackebrandtia endophytica]TQL78527.1 peptidase M23-like protein [Stackebrandtia endophytica]
MTTTSRPTLRISAVLALAASLALAVTMLIAPGTAVADEVGVNAKPNFKLPFPCGQVWSGQTRTNHSPQPSIDFNRANDLGDPVVASAPGTVTTVGNTGGTSYGRYIIISHASGWSTVYAHLSAVNVSKGQKVGFGKVIGKVGSTGGSTGPHLHFEQRLNGSAVKIAFDGKQALYWGTKNYKSTNGCGTASNPYTAKQVCGANFSQINSKVLTNGSGKKVARIVLMYNSSTKQNCVVTLKLTNLNKKTKTVAFLRVKDGPRGNDSGSFQYYAGPVKFKAASKCVQWGGSHAGVSFTSKWGHCG